MTEWERTMPNLPISVLNDVALQNNTTGQIDYIQFKGNTLFQSALFNYGIAGMNIVAHDNNPNMFFQSLVAQNPTTGFLDFLSLDGTGHLVSSTMSNVPVPRIIGAGFFGSGLMPGQFGAPLVAQFPNGELDILAFNGAGHLTASYALPSTIGLPQAVGVSQGSAHSQAFQLVGSGTTDNVIVQLPDGSLDVIGFSGDVSLGTLAYSSSFMLPGSAGSPPVGAINQDFGFDDNASLADASGHEGVQMVSQLPTGQLDTLYFDSGYNDAANEGVLYASSLTNLSMPGWHVVDAGAVAHNDLFPIT
jgi:hypothetical protein